MRKLKFILDRKSLETIYITFIRPLLEYADIIWDNCSDQEKKDLEKYKLELQELQQVPQNLFQSKSYTTKFVGNDSKLEDGNTNLFFSTKCTIL